MSILNVRRLFLGMLFTINWGWSQTMLPSALDDCPQTDLMCHPQWQREGRGVARLNNYIKGCYATAFLVAYYPDVDQMGRCEESELSYVPLAITNAHVFDINDDYVLDYQDLASVRSTKFEFNYSASVCSGPSPIQSPAVLGLKILCYSYGGKIGNDFALVKLDPVMFKNQLEKIQPYFFGVNLDPRFLPPSAVNIHHPRGLPKKINLSREIERLPLSNIYDVTWMPGGFTEVGSSGSPLIAYPLGLVLGYPAPSWDIIPGMCDEFGHFYPIADIWGPFLNQYLNPNNNLDPSKGLPSLDSQSIKLPEGEYKDQTINLASMQNIELGPNVILQKSTMQLAADSIYYTIPSYYSQTALKADSRLNLRAKNLNLPYLYVHDTYGDGKDISSARIQACETQPIREYWALSSGEVSIASEAALQLGVEGANGEISNFLYYQPWSKVTFAAPNLDFHGTFSMVSGLPVAQRYYGGYIKFIADNGEINANFAEMTMNNYIVSSAFDAVARTISLSNLSFLAQNSATIRLASNNMTLEQLNITLNGDLIPESGVIMNISSSKITVSYAQFQSLLSQSSLRYMEAQSGEFIYTINSNVPPLPKELSSQSTDAPTSVAHLAGSSTITGEQITFSGQSIETANSSYQAEPKAEIQFRARTIKLKKGTKLVSHGSLLSSTSGILSLKAMSDFEVEQYLQNFNQQQEKTFAQARQTVAQIKSSSANPGSDQIAKTPTEASPVQAQQNPDPSRSLQLSVFPNPFNAATQIRFSLGQASHVNVRIFNLLGALIDEADLGVRQPGEHNYAWNAAVHPTGTYLLRIETTTIDHPINRLYATHKLTYIR